MRDIASAGVDEGELLVFYLREGAYGFDFGHSPHPNPVWLVLGGAVAVVH
jgi:hypothetical protein